jgi:transcriptional regulator with XRE-family HTH domain
MNRLAVKIKEARLKLKLTEKQLAKKCGLTESYVIQIESGKKVINETAAETILKVLGEKTELVSQQDLIEESKPAEENKDKNKKEVFQPIQPTAQWEDALSNIIKKIPIYELHSNKIIGYKELPIIGKKIEGYHWDKILFVQSPNDYLEALRIQKNDIVMVCLTNEIQNNNIYLLEYNQKKIIRLLRKESNNRVIMSKGMKDEEREIEALNKIKIIGKCVKVEFKLD